MESVRLAESIVQNHIVQNKNAQLQNWKAVVTSSHMLPKPFYLPSRK